MEKTEDLDIDIEDIGTILKSSRLKQKKSMEDISSELCIRKIYLTALEEGDYDTLPPIPYGVGYVRCYARYLGLNSERAVKLYKAASEAKDNIEEEKKDTPEVNKSSSRHIVLGILALAAIYGGWCWYTFSMAPKMSEGVSQEETLSEDVQIQEITEETEEIAQENEITDENLEITTTIEEVQETKISIDQTLIPEETVVKEEVLTPKIDKDMVIVEFIGESWVELKDKNKVYFQGVFHLGDKKEIKYTDNLFISVGRPENVKVYVNGAEKDILAKRRKSNIPIDSLN